MNASVRWANEFMKELECVRCRKWQSPALYENTAPFTRVPVEDLTIEELRDRITTIDVWCSSCPRGTTQKLHSVGRRLRKKEASDIADIRIGAVIPSIYDQYVVLNGLKLTKHEVISLIKSKKCIFCEAIYPECVMTLTPRKGHKTQTVSVLTNTGITMQHLCRELEDHYVVTCANCARLYKADLVQLDERDKNIVFDENFWASATQ